MSGSSSANNTSLRIVLNTSHPAVMATRDTRVYTNIARAASQGDVEEYIQTMRNSIEIVKNEMGANMPQGLRDELCNAVGTVAARIEALLRGNTHGNVDAQLELMQTEFLHELADIQYRYQTLINDSAPVQTRAQILNGMMSLVTTPMFVEEGTDNV